MVSFHSLLEVGSWNKGQHEKNNNMGADENECNQSTFGRMLNACVHCGILWWFMCDREWFLLFFFFLTLFIVYKWVFGPCRTIFFFYSFNLTCNFIFYIFRLSLFISLWIWSLATVFRWQRFLVFASYCSYLTLSFLLYFSLSHTHTQFLQLSLFTFYDFYCIYFFSGCVQCVCVYVYEWMVCLRLFFSTAWHLWAVMYDESEWGTRTVSNKKKNIVKIVTWLQYQKNEQEKQRQIKM